jgi:soluble lytic murein transglycosylase-like protein
VGLLVTCPANSTYDALFRSAAIGAGVDPALVKAHAAVESNFNPRAYRYEAPRPTLPAGDASHGLMQLLYSTALHLGYQGARPTTPDQQNLTGLYAPQANIQLGAQLIAENLAAAGGDADTAIAAYNEGITRALEDRDAGTAWRTFDPEYVAKVKACWATYAADFPESVGPPIPPDQGAGGAAPSEARMFTLTPGRLALLSTIALALLTWGLKHFFGGRQ